MTHVESILWRRLDRPGHDICRLVGTENGWRLHGTSVFLHEAGPAQLTYDVRADSRWHTRHAQLDGRVDDQAVRIRVRRLRSSWEVNGDVSDTARQCLDLDLGFTPATNLLQLRRIALEIGEAAEVQAAWLDVPAGSLEVLTQRYERRTATTYWYEAPRFEYAALLEVSTAGFPRRYPGLWEEEG